MGSLSHYLSKTMKWQSGNLGTIPIQKHDMEILNTMGSTFSGSHELDILYLPTLWGPKAPRGPQARRASHVLLFLTVLERDIQEENRS